MGRWLGIDPGTRRIGVAVGSDDEAVTTPLKTVAAQPEELAVRQIQELASEYDVAGIVVGWPVNMDNTEGPQGKSARALAAHLARATGLDVRLWDERLSSFAADGALAGLLTRKKRKARRDAVAAAHILQDFLTRDGPATAPRPTDSP